MMEIVLPPLDTNADFVVLVEWLAGDGETIQANSPVCLVETSKTAVEITAPVAGVLNYRAAVGDKVAVGEVVATVVVHGEKAIAAPTPREHQGPPLEERVSRKARELMAQYGVEIEEFSAEGFITAADVEQRLAERKRKQQAAAGGVFALLDGVDTDGISFPDGCNELDEGWLDPVFFAQLRAEPDAFRKLPESERLSLLRIHGASIGDDVCLGEDTLVCAHQIILRDGASIGNDGTVWCAERFIMGPQARFGPHLSLRCQQAIVGAGVHAEHCIIIGGGGHRDPWAVISIGDDSYLGSELHLNTCRPVLIGRNVFVTNRVTLLTHNIGHSYLDGHENRFAPVVLEDECQVGFNTVVYAGARIGRGAVVGSNGYVIESIPRGKLALGVPARVVGEAQQALSPQRRLARGREIVGDLHKLLAAKGYGVLESTSEDADTLRLTHDGRDLGLALRPYGNLGRLPKDVNWVVLTIDAFSGESEKGMVVMDLADKRIIGTGDPFWTDTVREYLRKRGIKLQPGPWRYRGGLI